MSFAQLFQTSLPWEWRASVAFWRAATNSAFCSSMVCPRAHGLSASNCSRHASGSNSLEVRFGLSCMKCSLQYWEQGWRAIMTEWRLTSLIGSIIDKERRWFVGIDWGSQEHVVSLCDEGGGKIGQRKFRHGGTGLTDARERRLLRELRDNREELR